jgi:hypothetical protein
VIIEKEGLKNAVRLDRKPDFWHMEWCHTSADWLEKADPLTPFEADLIAYIDSEKRSLGLLP